ncbi:hypothetical protein ACIPSH_15845 [Streptomyces iakyrus]|uniref:hypothetical protein n=1 Tax=Streptomyces iakyrus TaxID=68219 RepID=UPI00381B5C4F
MDAGLAAVLGALAGSVATIGAALATGWAQREEARIAARAEHRRERREPRLEAYKAFILATSDLREQSTFFTVKELVPDDPGDLSTDLLFQAASALKDSALEVSLAGPRRVSKDAIKIQRLGSDLSTNVSLLKHALENPESVSQHLRRSFLRDTVATARGVSRAIDKFVLQAQAALDDDGSLS